MINKNKQKAIELLNTMEVYKNYINNYKLYGNIRVYASNIHDFIFFQQEVVDDKMKEIEVNFNCTIYAIICGNKNNKKDKSYSFLIVPNDKDTWDKLIDDVGDGTYFVKAFVWNWEDESQSGIQYVEVANYKGEIYRIE